MEDKSTASVEATPEQLLYAKVLEWGMYIGLLILFITFAIYAFGIMKPFIPLTEISQHWSKSVHEYLHDANIQAGWAWLGMLKYGDFVNFIGIAILAGVTILCYLSIVPTLLTSKPIASGSRASDVNRGRSNRAMKGRTAWHTVLRRIAPRCSKSTSDQSCRGHTPTSVIIESTATSNPLKKCSRNWWFEEFPTSRSGCSARRPRASRPPIRSPQIRW